MQRSLFVALTVMLCVAVSSFGAEPEREYFKQSGKQWHKVTRQPDGTTVAGEPVSAPTRAATTSTLVASTQGTSTFQPYVAYPVGSWPEAVAIADLNGDGRKDVALVTSSYNDPANDNMLHVFTQNADGTLTRTARYPIGGRPQTVAVGDVNGDGRMDVVVGNSSVIGVFLQNSTGTLDPMVSYATVNSYKVRVGDLNGDGRDDIVGINWGSRGDGVDVFFQDASGSLAPPVTYHVTHGGYDDLEIGDVNGDGALDIVVMSGQLYADSALGVLIQQPGTGTFLAPVYYNLPVTDLAHGVGIGDVNGDGLDDVVTSYGGNRPSSNIAVFLQHGGVLGAPTSLPSYDIPEPVEIGDVNGDGRPDVVTAHGGWNELGVYFGTSSNTLAAEQLFPIPYASHYNPHGLAIGDVTGDGLNDVVIADYNNGLIVLTQNDNSAPRVAVVAPQGARLQVGVPYEIQWTASDLGTGLASFDVSYSPGSGQPFTSIPACTGLGPDARSCTVTLPPPATSDGTIRVEARDGAGNLGSALGSYSLQLPVITVTTPAAANWGIGSSQAITWTDDLPAGATVDVALSRDGGGTWTTLTSGIADTGRFEWTVTGGATSAALVRVAWSAYPIDVSDVSDGPLSIAAPFILVTAPNTGGMTWTVGTAQTISWTHNLGTSALVAISISRDAGRTWTPLATVANNAAEAGSYVWKVTGPGTPKARVRVAWTNNPAVADQSDTNFRIR